jgi:hypothetical protein
MNPQEIKAENARSLSASKFYYKEHSQQYF